VSHDWKAEVEQFAARGREYADACAVAEAAVELEVEFGDLERGSPEFYRQVLDVARYVMTIP
jgi:hypothetical protein